MFFRCTRPVHEVHVFMHIHVHVVLKVKYLNICLLVGVENVNTVTCPNGLVS